MIIGNLRHRIEIQKLETVYDEENFPVKKYTTIQKVWADVNDLYGKDYWESKQQMSENQTIFHIRYNKNIDVNCYILFRGIRYEILEIDNIKYLNKELKIKTKMQVATNGN